METIKNEFRIQFEQTWRIYSAIVKKFDKNAWLSAGEDYMVPAKLAVHVLLGVEYYIERDSPWRKRFADGWASLSEEAMPSQEEIFRYLDDVIPAFNDWLEHVCLAEENDTFRWAGPTRSGIVIFLLRHTLYHLGELDALLHGSKKGDIGDMWMTGFSSGD